MGGNTPIDGEDVPLPEYTTRKRGVSYGDVISQGRRFNQKVNIILMPRPRHNRAQIYEKDNHNVLRRKHRSRGEVSDEVLCRGRHNCWVIESRSAPARRQKRSNIRRCHGGKTSRCTRQQDARLEEQAMGRAYHHPASDCRQHHIRGNILLIIHTPAGANPALKI